MTYWSLLYGSRHDSSHRSIGSLQVQLISGSQQEYPPFGTPLQTVGVCDSRALASLLLHWQVKVEPCRS